jgi:hypothetical protein
MPQRRQFFTLLYKEGCRRSRAGSLGLQPLEGAALEKNQITV